MRAYNVQTFSLFILTGSLLQNIALMCKCEQISPLVSWTDWAGRARLLDAGLLGRAGWETREIMTSMQITSMFSIRCALFYTLASSSL